MPTKKINKMADLPAWYSVENYSGTEFFTLSDWLAAFQLRSYIWLLQDGLEGNHIQSASDKATLIDNLNSVIARIENAGASAHENFKLRYSGDGVSSCVTSLEVGEIFEVNDAIKFDEFGKYKKAYQLDCRNQRLAPPLVEVQIPIELLDCAHDALDPNSFWLHKIAFAKIDLSASDTTIIDNFEVWLKEIRKTHRHVTISRERKFTDKDCLKWHKAGILPFLDLKIWSEQNSIDITDAVMCDAIFPTDREIVTTETIKKTTLPLAERIWSGDLINSLDSDLSGQNWNKPV